MKRTLGVLDDVLVSSSLNGFWLYVLVAISTSVALSSLVYNFFNQEEEV